MRANAAWAFPKRLISHSLCNNVTGVLLATWFNNRIPNRGCRFDTASNAVPAYKKAMIFLGLFESAEYRFVRDYLDPGLDVVEVGSGIGVISSFIAKKLPSGRRLICVEAHKQLLPLLERNLIANASHVEAEIVHAAVDPVADKNGEVSSFVCAASYTGSQLDNNGVEQLGRTELVKSVSLARILREHSGSWNETCCTSVNYCHKPLYCKEGSQH
jgi:FkbM family methyltransferase